MSRKDLVVRFAGEGGQGVVTAAEMLARSAATAGYHVLTFATFPSQIKGGPTWTQARISTAPVLSPGDSLDILVALNRHAYESHRNDVNPGGAIIYDSSFQVEEDGRAIGIPIAQLAKEAGEARSANMVILGALAHLVHMPLQYFEDFVRQRFAGRDAVIESNIKALNLGFKSVAEAELDLGQLEPPHRPETPQLLIRGNEAIALGAVAAGIDFYAGYPISPATSILVFMQRYLPGMGKFVYQVSSEIEAIAAIIGAGYAGKKAMTATSGPGLSLMSEGLGLAWMAEIPIVVVDVQRGGPSTGLPTKTEQSDLFEALHPTHGDVHMPVIAPGSVEECFYATVYAFNWAERYQGPVIILSEHSMAERVQNIPKPDLSALKVESRLLYQGSNGYLRYESPDLSPMPIPGHPGAYVANGSEHDPYGDTTHRPHRHVQGTRRRFGKLRLLNDGTYERDNTTASVAVLPWGGSKGPALEAYRILREQGVDVAWYFTMFLNPLPPGLLDELRQKDLVLVPELNYQGQLSSILRSYGVRAESITQYTGLPFKVRDLVSRIGERAEQESSRKVGV